MEMVRLSLGKTSRIASKLRYKYHGHIAHAADLEAEAMVAAVASERRYDANRLASPLTYAYAKMAWRVHDVLKRELRHEKWRQEMMRSVAMNGTAPGLSTAQLAVRKAIISVSAQMKTDERLLLREVYGADRSIADVARDGQRDNKQLERAHLLLLQRLRGKLGDYKNGG